MGFATKVWENFQGKGCHEQSHSVLTEEKRGKIAIVGSPNVGKSVLCHRLTGNYVTVSNYPGTTVEVSRGKGTIGEETFEIINRGNDGSDRNCKTLVRKRIRSR